ncbi:hypothetical protein ABPG75_011193 [Micractinium tetrahymenae]
MCFTCSGTGTTVECYDHRRLERSCPDCEGDGAWRQAGAGSAGGGDGPAPTQAANGPAPSCHTGGGSGAGSASTATRAARLAAYEQEMEALKASLAGCADEQEVRLQAELIAQIEQQAARLRGT